MDETKTIVYFKHGLGNLVMYTPAIQALASMDKSGKADMCLDSDWMDVRKKSMVEYLNKCNFVDRIIEYPEEEFTKKYNRWFYTGHAEHSKAIEVFKGKCKLHAQCPEWQNYRKHEIFFYMDIVYKMGYKGSIPKQYVPLIDEKQLTKSKKLKIGICNGAHSRRMQLNKKWEIYQEFVNTIKQYYDCNVYKIGFGDELEDITGCVDKVNKLSFLQTAKLISELDLLVTTDTANMHIGDALEVPMVVLFGGTLVSKNGPINGKSEIVRADLQCQPCQKSWNFYNCENNYMCMSEITVGDVMAKVRKVLE